MNAAFVIGEVHRVQYPFVRETVELGSFDGDYKMEGWKPGVRFESDGFDGTDSIADALGFMLLTVISVHKPGRFPERVFFTRQWEDPEFKVFGKTKLHISPSQTFRKLLRGYRHEFQLKARLAYATPFVAIEMQS